MKLTVIMEENGDALWGRIETLPYYLPVTTGRSIEEVEVNLQELLEDYIENEGKAFDEWKSVRIPDVEFEHVYECLS